MKTGGGVTISDKKNLQFVMAGFAIVIALLVMMVIMVSYMEVTKANVVEDVRENVTTVKAEQTISVMLAEGKCSCSHMTDYNVHARSYINHCPLCGKNDTLIVEWHPTYPEGIIVCSQNKGGCDADFCIVHGKEHAQGYKYYLKPSVEG